MKIVGGAVFVWFRYMLSFLFIVYCLLLVGTTQVMLRLRDCRRLILECRWYRGNILLFVFIFLMALNLYLFGGIDLLAVLVGLGFLVVTVVFVAVVLYPCLRRWCRDDVRENSSL